MRSTDRSPIPGTSPSSSSVMSASCSTVVIPAAISFSITPSPSSVTCSIGVCGAPCMADICCSTSWRFSSSLLMSIFQPSSFAASRTFWPFLPIAKDNCVSSTITSSCFSVRSAMETRLTLAGCNAFSANVVISSEYSIMSIFSPRNSRMIDCTRIPFMPTQAPTGSTSLSRLCTAILVRSPASRAIARTCTVPS